MTLTWTSAPEGEVLLPGTCVARDEDGQACVRGLVHIGAHASTGLRAWLETTESAGLIRAYEPARADDLEAMEAPLFAHFGFVPIARQDLVRTKSGGVTLPWVLFVGALLAPTVKVTFALRLVCFARS